MPASLRHVIVGASAGGVSAAMVMRRQRDRRPGVASEFIELIPATDIMLDPCQLDELTSLAPGPPGLWS
jgi:hypothetical protein